MLAALLALAGVAHARPGGGESFSGGGGHSSGGGGGGGGIGLIFELIYWLIQLIFYFPEIGIPLVLLIIGYFIYASVRRRNSADWNSGPPAELSPSVASEPIDEPTPRDLGELRKLDPAFSLPVFEDFAFRLFSTAHRARHSATTIATITPYVGADARAELSLRPPLSQPVQQVVVGAMRTYKLKLPDDTRGRDGNPSQVRVGIEYEANLATAEHTYYTVERWMFVRDASLHSKPPGHARTFPCPNCGAPWHASESGTQVCASCGMVVDNGRFDWTVEQVKLVSSDERPPTLTTEVAERGTELPTYRQNNVDGLLGELMADDPAVTADSLDARLTMIYRELNAAWSNNDLEPVRGLVSDGLFDYLQYWVDAYRAQHLRNALEAMRITRSAIAKVVRDQYYDAITIRVWGTGKDYVIHEPDGKHVRGSRTRDRDYSEYWTLIRAAGRKAEPHATPTCGNCGAPLTITQSGECEHCGAHVTAGEFDWVLSKIEQDDTYRG